MIRTLPARHARLVALADAVRGITGPFACGGARRLDSPVSLRFRDKTSFEIKPSRGEHWQQGDNAPLLERCAPPPPVGPRKARREVQGVLQLDAGAFSVGGFDPAAAGVLEGARRQLFAGDPEPPSAELVSVLVCNEQGALRQKPSRGDGLLIVCLPSLFSAGQLVVSYHGAHQVFDWGWEIGKTPDTICWAAFLGDASHSVEPVWSGSRVSLVYSLRRGKGARRGPPVDAGALMVRALDEALGDATFLPEGGVLVFPCFHAYSDDPRFQRELGHLSAQSASALEGRDRLLALAAVERGLPVELRPYLVESSADTRWELEYFPSTSQRARLALRMNEGDLLARLPGARRLGQGAPSTHWINDPPGFTWAPHFYGDDRDGNPIPPDPDLPALRHLHSCDYSPTGHGHDGVHTALYLYSALHVVIPAAAERRDQAPVEPPTQVSEPPSVEPSSAPKKAPKKAPAQEASAREVVAQEVVAEQVAAKAPARKVAAKKVAAGEVVAKKSEQDAPEKNARTTGEKASKKATRAAEAPGDEAPRKAPGKRAKVDEEAPADAEAATDKGDARAGKKAAAAGDARKAATKKKPAKGDEKPARKTSKARSWDWSF